MIEKIILKKSSVLDKMPAAEQLDYGEIALNYNAEHPFLSFKDSDGDIMPLNDYSQDIAYLYSHKLDAGVLDVINENSDNIKKKLNITDFNAFKSDNTKTINALDSNVSQNGSEIQNNTTAIATLNTTIEQKADKTDLDTKVNKTDIAQTTGTSETSVMSQKASTMAFAANTPSGDPLHNMYVEIGAIYNDTGKDIERVDQWGDTIMHKEGFWYLNGIGDLTNYDLLKCWIWGNCIRTNYKFSYSSHRFFMDCATNIHQNIKDTSQSYFYNLGGIYQSMEIVNKYFTTFSFNERNANTANNVVKNLLPYSMYSTGIIKYYGWIVVGSIGKYTFSASDGTECVGLVLTQNSYVNLPKLRAECIRQIIDAVRATDNITITLHPEAYERAIADTGVQAALANKTNVSLAKGE